MKNKLNVMLAALLLSFSLIPTQILTISLKDFNTFPTISEVREPETSNNLKTLESTISQSDVRIQSDDPIIIGEIQ